MAKSTSLIKSKLRAKKKKKILIVLIILILLGVATYLLGNLVIKQKENNIAKISTVKINRLGDVYAFGFVNTGASYDIFAYNTNHEIIKLISVPKDDAVTAIEYDNNKLYVARESGIQFIDLISDNYKLENLIEVNANDDEVVEKWGISGFWLDDFYVYNNRLYYENGHILPAEIANISLNETNLFKNPHIVVDNLPSTYFKIDKKNNRIYYDKGETLSNDSSLYYKDLGSGIITLAKSDSKGKKIIYTERDSYSKSYNDAIIGLYFFDPKTQNNTLISANSHEYTQVGDNVYYINYGDNKIHKYDLSFKSDRVVYENIDDTYKLKFLDNVGNNLIKIYLDNGAGYGNNNWSIKFIDTNGNLSSFIAKDLSGNMEEYSYSNFKQLDFTLKYIQ